MRSVRFTLFLTNNSVRRLSVLSTTAVQPDGLVVALGVRVVVVRTHTTPANDETTPSRLLKTRQCTSKLTDVSVKVQLQTVPKKTSFHRSSIDQGTSYKVEPVASSRVQQFEGLSIIKPDPINDMGLVDIAACLFTAYNEQLAAVEMASSRSPR